MTGFTRYLKEENLTLPHRRRRISGYWFHLEGVALGTRIKIKEVLDRLRLSIGLTGELIKLVVRSRIDRGSREELGCERT